MDQEKWDNLKGLIKEKFEILAENQGELNDRPGKCQEIEFKGPLGKMKVQRLITPRVVDKKTLYSRRIGSDVKVDYVYDKQTMIDRLKVYKWDETKEDWLEITTQDFNI